MRVLAIVHQRDAGPGVFGAAVRERGGELDVWLPPEGGAPAADPLGYDAVLVLGGAVHPDQAASHGWIDEERQLLRRLLASEAPLLAPLAPGFEAFQWHSYEFPLPPGAVALAESDVCLQACRIGARAWALQFHPEVSASDALDWIDDYCSDEDAVRIGLDPAPLRAETEAKIAAFNQLGRDLCERWLATAQP